MVCEAPALLAEPWWVEGGLILWVGVRGGGFEGEGMISCELVVLLLGVGFLENRMDCECYSVARLKFLVVEDSFIDDVSYCCFHGDGWGRAFVGDPGGDPEYFAGGRCFEVGIGVWGV